MYGVLLPPGGRESPGLPNHNASDPAPMSLAPPPPAEFNSREETLEYLKAWAKTQGFAVVIGRSRSNRLWIKCDRGGEYADKHMNDPENRKRKRKATRLTGCPFNVKASMKKDQIWRCHTENPNHNHGPSDDLSLHPSIRRMTDDQQGVVNEMTEAGKTPIETMDELKRLWPEIQVLKRDIYNARKKYKTEKELREVEEGSHLPQPYEDPNGSMPGPTRTGHWEWLEDGDEVKRKKRKARSNVNVLDSSTPGLDANNDDESPRMSSIGLVTQSAQATRRTGPNLSALTNTYHQPGLSSTQPSTSRVAGTDFNSSMTGYPPQNPRQFRQYQATTPLLAPQRTYTPTPHNTNTDPMLQSSIPARGRQADMASMAPMMTPMMQTPSVAPVPMPTQNPLKPAQPSGQVLMSRIERMEKEQNEQKNMLAQILSAVQSGTRR